jgi:hypothetical protein
MGLFKTIGLAVAAVGRLFGFGRQEMPVDALAHPVEVARPAFMPAVAGFVQRAHVDRFRLAARLASVAKLNTPLGRKPRTSNKRAIDLPAVPVERLGAKKVRLCGNQGPRVLKPAPKVALPASNVIRFPVVARGPAIQAISSAKAA